MIIEIQCRYCGNKFSIDERYVDSRISSSSLKTIYQAECSHCKKTTNINPDVIPDQMKIKIGDLTGTTFVKAFISPQLWKLLDPDQDLE